LAERKRDVLPREQLSRELFRRKTMYQTFKKALLYLDASGKIMVDRNDRVVWVGVL